MSQTIRTVGDLKAALEDIHPDTLIEMHVETDYSADDRRLESRIGQLAAIAGGGFGPPHPSISRVLLFGGRHWESL